MAVDGSFRIEYELERFLCRCPKLATVPQLDLLAKKGGNLSEEELINGVAELFLLPRYTIPLVGCFRPIAQRIVDRVVDLLRLVPDLTSDSSDSMVEFDEERIYKEAENSENEETLCIINLYVECGRGLSLHELSCFAFSRALDLVPYLLGSVRSYFSFAPPPFKRIMEEESMVQSLTLAGGHLLNAVRVSYRFLLAESEVFAKLWDWSCYLDLVHRSTDVYRGDSKLLKDVRWCALQVLSVILKMNDGFVWKKKKMSDTASADFGFDAEEAFRCLLRWQEFLQDVSLEKASWYLEPLVETKLDSFEKEINGQSLAQDSLAVNRSEIGQSSWINREATRDIASSGRAFVLTSAVKKSFEMILLAVSQRWPVLLYGPAGAGKTALISRLAQSNGSRVLSIQMDEQIDGKTLIGSYICVEQPGEFRWQPGSLTQAVRNGLWVVFEDIDKAPADVHSILLPLLEGASSFLTGHGEPIRVSEGFRLFSTVSSSRLDASTAAVARNSLGALWRRVMVSPPSSEDLLNIVKAWYPDLEAISGKLIETFERVNQLAGFVTFTSFGRFSLRDLLKWCKRIAGLGFHFWLWMFLHAILVQLKHG